MDPGVDDLYVCGSCGGLGTMTGSADRVQVCACDRASAGGSTGGSDPRHHFELCGLCASVVVRSGSRWSMLLCSDCLALARAANEMAGLVVVPVGRHSLHHRIAVRASQVEDPSTVSTFLNDLGGLHAALDALTDWKAQLVAARLAGQGQQVELPVYLQEVDAHPPDRAALLDQFVAKRRSRPEAG